jgi:hypothetical protein
MNSESTSHVLTLGREQFVAGMFWQALSSGEDLDLQARMMGEDLQFDLYVACATTSTAMLGFCHRTSKTRKGVLSLAAAVASAIGSRGVPTAAIAPMANWLGVFRLPMGEWWYLAVRDFAVVAGTDFVGSQTDAVDRMRADLALGEWSGVIGDRSMQTLNLPHFNAVDLHQALAPAMRQSGFAKQFRLMPVAVSANPLPNRQALTAVVAVAAMAGLGGAVYYFEPWKLGAAAVTQVTAPPPPPPVPLPHPWKSEPLVVDALDACLAGFRRTMPVGWALEEFRCGINGNTIHTIKRDGGFVGTLVEQVSTAVLDVSGDKAALPSAVNMPVAAQDEALVLPQHLFVNFYGVLQPLGLNASMEATPMPPPPPSKPGEPVYLPADWVTFRWSADLGTLQPKSLEPLLNSPGVRFAELIYKDASGWTIKGVAYAKK